MLLIVCRKQVPSVAPGEKSGEAFSILLDGHRLLTPTPRGSAVNWTRIIRSNARMATSCATVRADTPSSERRRGRRGYSGLAQLLQTVSKKLIPV